MVQAENILERMKTDKAETIIVVIGYIVYPNKMCLKIREAKE